MWKGKYYEELLDPRSSEDIASSLYNDLQNVQLPSLVIDQIEKFMLTENTVMSLMGNIILRQQLVYIVDKERDSELQELFSFISMIYHQKTEGLGSRKDSKSFKDFLLSREKKYGKTSPKTYLARKCYAEELRSSKKSKGFKLLRKNFDILLENQEMFPYGVFQEEARYFMSYYNLETESHDNMKAYKIFREYINEGRRTYPNSTFVKAFETIKFM